MKKTLLVLGLAAGLAFSSTAIAADQYWYGNSQNWTTNANWSSTDVTGGAQTWVQGNNAFFGSVANRVQVTADVTANNVTVTKAALDMRFTANRTMTINGVWSDLSSTTYNSNLATGSSLIFTFSSNSTSASTMNGSFTRTTGTSGTIGFTKNGTSQLIYSGNTTTSLMGPVLVNAGSLIITGALNTSTGFTVSANATLGGESSDAGVAKGKVSAITLNGGTGLAANTLGYLSPGNGTAGDLGSLYGTSLTLNGAANSGFGQLKFDLSNSSATSDFLSLSGAVTKGSGSFFTFDFGNTGDIATARTYTLMTAAGGFGTFAAGDFSYTGLNTGATGSFNINGNNLEFITVVPEPATWALLAFSLTTVMVLRRRRRS